MKYLFFAFFFLVCVSLFGQFDSIRVIRPSSFTEETSPDNDNFEMYSQKGGVNRRAQLYNLKKYFAPVVDIVPVSTVPTQTGNMAYLMRFVEDPNGDIWYVDGLGNGVQFAASGGTAYSFGTGVDESGGTVYIDLAELPIGTPSFVTGVDGGLSVRQSAKAFLLGDYNTYKSDAAAATASPAVAIGEKYILSSDNVYGDTPRTERRRQF